MERIETSDGYVQVDEEGVLVVVLSYRKLFGLMLARTRKGGQLVSLVGLALVVTTGIVHMLTTQTYSLAGVFIAYMMGHGLVNFSPSGETRISVDSITQMNGLPGRRYITVSRFVVHHEANGSVNRTTFRLPGVIVSGPDAFERAKKVFSRFGIEVG